SQNLNLGTVFHRRNDPNNHDNQLDIVLSHQLPGGTWEIELEALGGNTAIFHAWIERDDQKASSHFATSDNDSRFTISSIACGRDTIVVGSYDATDSQTPISNFSAEGPTRDDRHKPEVSAPGHGVFAACSRTNGTTQKWGTSMAAPHVTGLIALLLQVAPQL